MYTNDVMGVQGQEQVVGVAEVVANIREQLRQWSRDKELEVGELRGRLLGLCDAIRDELLPPLGVRLEDREAGECVCVYGERVVM